MVLMRLFLILPAGLQPVFRRQANLLVAAADRLGLQRLVSRTARSLFVIHGLLAIVILVHFPRVMAIFFNLRHWTDQAFGVFALVVPGLVFHSLAIAMTPLFEAIQATDRLKRLALVVAAANTVLNLNLIPFAGLPARQWPRPEPCSFISGFFAAGCPVMSPASAFSGRARRRPCT